MLDPLTYLINSLVVQLQSSELFAFIKYPLSAALSFIFSGVQTQNIEFSYRCIKMMGFFSFVTQINLGSLWHSTQHAILFSF